MSILLDMYKRHLNLLIFLSIAIGGAAGFFVPEYSEKFSFLGELFIRLLTLLIVPVIIVSMLSGILNLGDTANLGKIGLKTVCYYLVTTALAVCVGLVLVNLIKPGTEGATLAMPETMSANVQAHATGLMAVMESIVPKNIISAASAGNVLGLIFFSVFFGIAILQLKHPAKKTIADCLGALFEAILWMVDRVMLLAPIGIFSLVYVLVSGFVTNNTLVSLGESIGWYSLTVILGLLFHACITLPILLAIFKINPFRFFKQMFPALVTAFSTASSAATLPITIDSLEKRAGVSNQTASFVAPLGATVNMDGTAIYEAVAAIFIANMYGVELSSSQQLIVFLTATFSAIGAAGIPGAGLIMMTLVLHSVGLPVEGIQLIVVVDRVLDMLRTSINVWGDSTGAIIIDKV